MKKYLLAASMLLLFASVSFAQMGGIVDPGEGARHGGPPTAPKASFFQKGNKLTDVGGMVQVGSSILKLTGNALFIEKHSMGADLESHTDVAWSVPLSGSVKELVFRPDGNLVVLDATGNVLWNTGTANKGEQVKLNPDGLLEVLDKNNNPLWQK